MENTEEIEKNSEKRIAITITVFAAILAINGLFGGKYGDDEMIANQKHSQMYTWYQSKGQKKMLAENKKDLLEIFEKSGTIKNDHMRFLDSLSSETDINIDRYKKEMDEIRRGSQAVGKQNWIQEQKGELGQIIGADEYELEAEKLGRAGDFFDYGDLALNLSLVLGALALIMSGAKEKASFLLFTSVLGIIGSIFTAYALYIAMFS